MNAFSKDEWAGEALAKKLAASNGTAGKPAVPAFPGATQSNYYDFTHDKDIVIVKDEASLQEMLAAFRAAVSGKTAPIPVALDTETTAANATLSRYFSLQQRAAAVYAELDNTQRTDPAWPELKAQHEDLRSQLSDMGKLVQKAGLQPYMGQVRLIQLYAAEDIPDIVWVIDRWALSPDQLDAAKRLVCSNRILWIGHNLYFDCKMLGAHGWYAHHVPHCTLLQAHAIDPLTTTRKTLAARCAAMLGREPSKELQASDWGRPDLDEAQVRYAAGDVVATYELHVAQVAYMREHAANPVTSTDKGHFVTEDLLNSYRLMRGTIPALTEIHLAGMPFDVSTHQTVCDQMEKDDVSLRAEAEAAFASMPGAPEVVNIGSNQQVAAWLEWALTQTSGSPDSGRVSQRWPRTETGQLSITKTTIALFTPMLEEPYRKPLYALRKWMKVHKLNTTLGHSFRRWINSATKRVHGSFRIGTETHRFSVTDPALQTISRGDDFRRLFRESLGRKLVICDYGQIEVRVAACLSQDQALLDIIENGLDLHTSVAREAFKGQYPDDATDDDFKHGNLKWMRHAAKTTVFATLYGAGPNTIVVQLKAQGLDNIDAAKAQSIQASMFGLFPDLAAFMDMVRDEAMGNPIIDPSDIGTGYVWTPGGSVYKPLYSRQLYTKSVNTPVQGGAAEIMLKALAAFPEQWTGLDARLIHVVHDELIASAPAEQAEQVKERMVKAMTDAAIALFPNMPRYKLVDAGVGESWGDK